VTLALAVARQINLSLRSVGQSIWRSNACSALWADWGTSHPYVVPPSQREPLIVVRHIRASVVLIPDTNNYLSLGVICRLSQAVVAIGGLLIIRIIQNYYGNEILTLWHTQDQPAIVVGSIRTLHPPSPTRRSSSFLFHPHLRSTLPHTRFITLDLRYVTF
jgi:hypothetical protein